MKIGYARIPSKTHNIDHQIKKLRNYGCHKIFSENMVLSRINSPELSNAIKLLKNGDIFVVCSLEKLGRSLPDLIRLVLEISNKGAYVYPILENEELGGNLAIMPDHLTILCRWLDRFITASRSECSSFAFSNVDREKQRKARRNITLEKMRAAYELRKAGFLGTEIAKQMDVTPSSVYTWCSNWKNHLEELKNTKEKELL